jgi:acyl-CoA reductase-like NAD-dependent aldehyde dehydrogenase
MLFASYKIAAPLALGNAVILKPAEQTPLTALYLGKLAQEVGFPPGLLSVLPGRGETTGAALVEHPGIDKLAFTGSVETGKEVSARAARTLKAVSLELGGKSPNIVFPDAPLEEAVMGAFFGIFFNHGQVCTAGSRLLVAEEIYDEFVPELVGRASGMRLGHGLDEATDMGPLVSGEQRQRFDSYVRIGHEENAELLTGGGHGDPGLGGGYFVEPTIFAGGDLGGRLLQEEVFGPLLSVTPFADAEEAARLANSTKFGLAAGVWTRDLGTAHRMAATLDAGTVWVNTYNRFDPASPIGGFRESGVGRELGESSLDLYTELKSVWINTAV